MARPRHAELHLVHALLPPAHSSAASGYLHDAELDGEQLQKAREAMRCRASAFGVTTSEVRRGGLEEEILKAAAALQADVLVTGVPASEARTHALLGSVGERLIRASSVPVISVPANATGPEGLRRVLLPTDLSPLSDTAVGRLCALFSLFAEETDVHLVHVLDLPSYLLARPSFVEELSRAVRIELHELAARHRTGNVRIHEEVLRGKAAEVIGERAKALNVDLIAMPSHGRTGLSRFFLGSVAERVARAGVRPTLTFHPAQAGEHGAP